MLQPLSPDRLRAHIANSLTGDFGQHLEYHLQIGSTNDRLRELAESGAPHGALVITDEQIRGRGRMGRSWHAPAHTAVLMSVLFRPELPPQQANRLVMCCGLALREAAKPLDVAVKWPNDLLVDGKKAAGILPESVLMGGTLHYTIVGMGVNVNNHFEAGSALAQKATSLAQAGGQPLDREAFVAATLHHLNRIYARLHHPWLHRTWQAACLTIGQHVRVRVALHEVLEGHAERITAEGQLVLRTAEGAHHTLSLSDTSVISSQNP